MDPKKLKWFDRLLVQILRITPRGRPPDPGRLPKSVLIVKLSAMGDALCLMPSMKSLAKALPKAQIDWLTTYRTTPQLFEYVPFINQIMVLPTAGLGLACFLIKYSP